MNKPIDSQLLSSPDAYRAWEQEYAATIGTDRSVSNRSGVAIQPLYTERDWSAAEHAGELGLPGQPPYTRGIYATMHRGRTWSQRQLIGHGTPAEYNERLREILAQGATAISLIPCNSVFRGYDMDESHIELLGTCGTVINTWADMDRALQGVDLARISCAQNDPSPFTLLAFMLVAAKRRGTDWRLVSGTSNQSDYLSHYVANHMFFRIALPGARRILGDHIAFCTEHLPKWNPMSVVGQHMQQAGATPAEAVAFTLATAIQNAEDCIARGMDPDDFLPR
ncbi:MAG TPA: methylmalonyl-CoA mutase family protein, partial [Ramlibacter sp.]|nr:methylmalonyl-CoA mutase family protein [Ramlibacter sp.]